MYHSMHAEIVATVTAVTDSKCMYYFKFLANLSEEECAANAIRHYYSVDLLLYYRFVSFE